MVNYLIPVGITFYSMFDIISLLCFFLQKLVSISDIGSNLGTIF